VNAAGLSPAAGRAAGRATEGLRARADTGDWSAAERLAELLAERGDIEGLRARADTGDWSAAERLAELKTHLSQVDVDTWRPLPGEHVDGRMLQLTGVTASTSPETTIRTADGRRPDRPHSARLSDRRSDDCQTPQGTGNWEHGQLRSCRPG